MIVKITNEEPLFKWIRSEISNEDTVLDLGCGICNPIKNIKCKHITGVDIFEGYRPLAEKILNEFKVADVTKIDFPDKSFDVILILDLVEHLNYEDAVKLIEKAEKWAKKKVIVFTPIGFLEQNLKKGLDPWGYPNPAQQHLCGFDKEFFIQRGYNITEYPGDKAHNKAYTSMYCIKVIKYVNVTGRI